MSDETATRMAIIAAHGTLDAAYPPLILATTAAALEMEVAIGAFFIARGIQAPGLSPRELAVAIAG
jgi:peroxiredoxin family protein